MDSEPTPAVILTDRQRRVLWFVSVGYTRAAIAKTTGWDLSSVKHICLRARRTLNAVTDAQAVRTALLDGHIGPYEDCGSVAAYRRHIKRDEDTCAACKRGNRERVETDALLRAQDGKLAEPHVRLLRCMHQGRSNLQIRQNWRIDERTLERLIAATYTLLGVAHLDPKVRREEALRAAAERGLLVVDPSVPAQPVREPVHLSETQVKVLTELSRGSSLAQAATVLNMRPGTVSTRLSEAYQRLGVAWMDKDRRRPEAIRRARAAGLLPEPVAT